MRQRINYEVGDFAATLIFNGKVWDLESIKITVLNMDNIDLHIEFLKLLKTKIDLLNMRNGLTYETQVKSIN